MTGTELLVIVAGLLLGYWMVSRLFGGKSDNGRTQQYARQTAEAEPAHEQIKREQEKRQRATDEPPPPPDDAPLPWPKILQVSQTASRDEIKKAYQSLIRQYHPDKVASLGTELRELCERKTKAINVAYDEAMKLHGGQA